MDDRQSLRSSPRSCEAPALRGAEMGHEAHMSARSIGLNGSSIVVVCPWQAPVQHSVHCVCGPTHSYWLGSMRRHVLCCPRLPSVLFIRHWSVRSLCSARHLIMWYMRACARGRVCNNTVTITCSLKRHFTEFTVSSVNMGSAAQPHHVMIKQKMRLSCIMGSIGASSFGACTVKPKVLLFCCRNLNEVRPTLTTRFLLFLAVFILKV